MVAFEKIFEFAYPSSSSSGGSSTRSWTSRRPVPEQKGLTFRPYIHRTAQSHASACRGSARAWPFSRARDRRLALGLDLGLLGRRVVVGPCSHFSNFRAWSMAGSTRRLLSVCQSPRTCPTRTARPAASSNRCPSIWMDDPRKVFIEMLSILIYHFMLQLFPHVFVRMV